MIETMIMLGGKGGELFPLTKATVQTNVISDYPQYGSFSSLATNSDGTVVATFNSNSTAIKISRLVSGSWTLESTTTLTYPPGSDYLKPPLQFSADGTKLFALTSGEVIAIERSGSTWTKSVVVAGNFDAIEPVSYRDGVATFKNNGDGTFSLKVYTKPVSSWTVLQTINITGGYCSFSISDNGDYIVTNDGSGTSSKTYVTYKWNGATFASNGNAVVSITSGGVGSHARYAISDDGNTLVISSTPLSGGVAAVVAKYSGGSWSQVTTPNFSIPSIESYILKISSDGGFIATLGPQSSYAYRLSSSGIFISKHTLTPPAYATNLIGPPQINPSGSEIYTPIATYGTGPIHLQTNKR